MLFICSFILGIAAVAVIIAQPPPPGYEKFSFCKSKLKWWEKNFQIAHAIQPFIYILILQAITSQRIDSIGQKILLIIICLESLMKMI